MYRAQIYACEDYSHMRGIDVIAAHMLVTLSYWFRFTASKHMTLDTGLIGARSGRPAEQEKVVPRSPAQRRSVKVVHVHRQRDGNGLHLALIDRGVQLFWKGGMLHWMCGHVGLNVDDFTVGVPHCSGPCPHNVRFAGPHRN